MKKLNCDYTVTNINGVIINKGHFNYSLSHYIYALYQKNFLYSSNVKPSLFWDSFGESLQNISLVAFAFVNNTPQILNKKTKVGVAKMMHAFGYFAFKDIGANDPLFIKNNRNRVYLVDSINSAAMSFGYKIPNKKPTNNYARLYMATFDSYSNKELINKNGTFKLKIVDPKGKNTLDNELINRYNEYKQKVLEKLDKPLEYKINFSWGAIKVYISKHEINKSGNNVEVFCGDDVYVYVEELLKF